MDKKIVICFGWLIFFTSVRAQVVFYHLSQTEVYSFLDELANQKIIDINSAIKPYSRLFIAQKLSEAQQQAGLLSESQKKQIDFLLRDFNKELFPGKSGYKKRHDLFFYKDSLFTLSVNPIGGYQIWKNENDNFYHRWVGAEAFGYVDPHAGVYASLRDNTHSRFLSLPQHLTQMPAAVYKHGPNAQGGDFSESRGGITYAWKWGHAGIIKDHFTWGSNYHGANIFSGHVPSFPHITLQMKPRSWFEFNYIHGFLVSDVLDTSRTYVGGVKKRSVFFPKFLAANMYTFSVLNGLKASIGNSIVYSDEFQLAYLIPVYFFKSVDHTVTNTGGNFTGQNSQMYFDINSRQIKYLNLYLSVFIDEISIGDFWDSEKQSNFISGKIGAAVSPPVIRNSTFVFEYTRTNPVVYKHFVNTTTFESNEFNMGHYLRDNAQEIYAAVRYRPIAKLYLEASLTLAEKGEDYAYLGTGNSGIGLPFIEKTFWKSDRISFSARFEVINDGFVFASVESVNTTGQKDYLDAYTPSVMQGKLTNISAGINFGF